MIMINNNNNNNNNPICKAPECQKTSVALKPVYEVLLQVQTLKSMTVWQHMIHIHHKPF